MTDLSYSSSESLAPIGSGDPAILLKAIKTKLTGTFATKKLTTKMCDKSAVCWNWVIYGGAREKEDQPSDYYEAALVAGDGKETKSVDPEQHQSKIEIIKNSALAKGDLAKAKELAFTSGGKERQKGLDEFHARVLSAILKDRGFKLSSSKDLAVRLWFKPKSGPHIFDHLEFVYDGSITITKGADEDLYAIEGLTRNASSKDIIVYIEPASLNDAHRKALYSLATASLEKA